MIVYIHGFNSSPSSHKSKLLRERLAACGRESEFACPALPHWPAQAMAMLEREIAHVAPDEVTLVGSSLGGFYATWLTEKFGMRSVLVNPAITPHEGLRAYLGAQKNLYTREEYVLTEEHLAQLAALRVDEPKKRDKYLLVHTTGDELLDWRIAADRYHGCRQVIVQGGDHGFAGFGAYLDIVLEFAGIHALRV
ncbi:MAG TPA: YqiA/YcfP family alpha/beta fold hydrolase [Burkholderiales bacterium]|nr:YqiA/YcfP family alpha/beta fold hydrolase [Burkholderiales bacterium]